MVMEVIKIKGRKKSAYHKKWYYELEQQPQQNPGPASPGCTQCPVWPCRAHTPTSICTNACAYCLFILQSRATAIATCTTLSPLIKSPLPGNLVAWQHEHGSPSGDFSRVWVDWKQKGSRKGRSLAPTAASHLSPLCARGAHRGSTRLPCADRFGLQSGRRSAVTPSNAHREAWQCVHALVAWC